MQSQHGSSRTNLLARPYAKGKPDSKGRRLLQPYRLRIPSTKVESSEPDGRCKFDFTLDALDFQNINIPPHARDAASAETRHDLELNCAVD